MYSKALYGYEQVFGPEYTNSKTLRDKLCALDAIVEDRVLVGVIGPVDDLQGGPSHLGIQTTPSTSKQHKLFRKLSLRFRL
jgi:hypothetical protein